MSKKISDELRAMMEDKETNRDKKIPVRVTMKDDISAEDATRKLGVNTGFDILSTVVPWGENSIQRKLPKPFVAGSVSIKDIQNLADIPEVEEITRDEAGVYPQ